jgi:surface antigen
MPVAAAALAIMLAVALSGCARVGLGDVTGSIKPKKASPALVTDRVDPSDWRMIQNALAQIPPGGTAGSEMAWQNPQTGSDGTITAVAAMAKGGGPFCRAFATTVNDLKGIRRYRGLACKDGGGNWQLSQVTVDDGAS